MAGLPIWGFCWRSLPRRYAWSFAREVVLRDPRRTLASFAEYRRWLKEGRREGDISYLLKGDEGEFIQGAAREGLVVGVGFCQKQMPGGNGAGGCPAGRANHDCLFQEGEVAHPACSGCSVAGLGREALSAGAGLYIMTSAYDIAQDLLIPASQGSGYSRAILFLCPYSVEVIALPLLICGMEGLVVSFISGRGDCVDYAEWLQADQGVKPVSTELEEASIAVVMELLREMHLARKGEAPFSHFERRGNIYYPEK